MTDFAERLKEFRSMLPDGETRTISDPLGQNVPLPWKVDDLRQAFDLALEALHRPSAKLRRAAQMLCVEWNDAPTGTNAVHFLDKHTAILASALAEPDAPRDEAGLLRKLREWLVKRGDRSNPDNWALLGETARGMETGRLLLWSHTVEEVDRLLASAPEPVASPEKPPATEPPIAGEPRRYKLRIDRLDFTVAHGVKVTVDDAIKMAGKNPETHTLYERGRRGEPDDILDLGWGELNIYDEQATYYTAPKIISGSSTEPPIAGASDALRDAAQRLVDGCNSDGWFTRATREWTRIIADLRAALALKAPPAGEVTPVPQGGFDDIAAAVKAARECWSMDLTDDARRRARGHWMPELLAAIAAAESERDAARKEVVRLGKAWDEDRGDLCDIGIALGVVVPERMREVKPAVDKLRAELAASRKPAPVDAKRVAKIAAMEKAMLSTVYSGDSELRLVTRNEIRKAVEMMMSAPGTAPEQARRELRERVEAEPVATGWNDKQHVDERKRVLALIDAMPVEPRAEAVAVDPEVMAWAEADAYDFDLSTEIESHERCQRAKAAKFILSLPAGAPPSPPPEKADGRLEAAMEKLRSVGFAKSTGVVGNLGLAFTHVDEDQCLLRDAVLALHDRIAAKEGK
jgi:hypothetical protein